MALSCPQAPSDSSLVPLHLARQQVKREGREDHRGHSKDQAWKWHTYCHSCSADKSPPRGSTWMQEVQEMYSGCGSLCPVETTVGGSCPPRRGIQRGGHVREQARVRLSGVQRSLAAHQLGRLGQTAYPLSFNVLLCETGTVIAGPHSGELSNQN